MAKDFGLTPADREKIMAAPDIKTPAQIEAEILAAERQNAVATALSEAEVENIDRGKRENFKIRAGARLPEKFINPPLGDPAHLCVDRGGIYRPDWCQLLIERRFDGQRDPQPFPLGSRYTVKLETWTDVPPEVIVSITDAVEEHHRMDFKPGDIELGKMAEDVVTFRRRFSWHMMKSA